MELTFTKIAASDSKKPDYDVKIAATGASIAIGKLVRSVAETTLGPIPCWRFKHESPALGPDFERKTLGAVRDEVEKRAMTVARSAFVRGPAEEEKPEDRGGVGSKVPSASIGAKASGAAG